MPTLRILNGDALVFATPGVTDPMGFPAFSVGSGNIEKIELDYTGWLGAATLAGSTWTVNGALIVSSAIVGRVASALVQVPLITAVPLYTGYYGPSCVPPIMLGHVAQGSDGRARRMVLRLAAVATSIDSNIVFDLAILG